MELPILPSYIHMELWFYKSSSLDDNVLVLMIIIMSK